MIWKSEWKPLVWIVSGFLVAFYLPIGVTRFDNAILEAFRHIPCRAIAEVPRGWLAGPTFVLFKILLDISLVVQSHVLQLFCSVTKLM